MKNKFFKFFIVILFVSLSACQGEVEEGLDIEHSYVEFGSKENTDDRKLHFRVQIKDYGLEPELEYKVRFIIQDPYIQDLTGTEEVEVAETYKTLPLPNDETRGLVTGSSVEMKREFSIDKIRKTIEKEEAVIVEIYDDKQVIAREEVSTLLENIRQLVSINPHAKIKTIDLKETNDIAIFSRAISDSIKEEGIVYIEYPKYSFSVGDESYFLWIGDMGRIMNTKDPYTIYLISNSSLQEIKKYIDKD